jgi:membrane protease YdiL (CAAX protease family)
MIARRGHTVGRPAVAGSARVPRLTAYALHGYALLIVGAEIVGASVGVVPGALCDALIILILLNHALIAARAWRDPADEAAALRGVEALAILALLPLLRLLSLAMPIPAAPRLAWYPLIGLPLLVAAGLTVRLLRLPAEAIGLAPRPRLPQAGIALSGIPLGLAGFLLFRPAPPLDHLDWRAVLIAAPILIVFTGFTEEFIFRGLVQPALRRALGAPGLMWSAVLFAGAYLGNYSPGYVLFIAIVGLYFGWCVERTGSIWGVALAHAGLTTGMLLVFPLIWR